MQNAVQAAANIWGISSDEQINKMRAFITEMVLIELSNLKQFDIVFKKKGIRSLDTLYCPKCGSNNVEERAWVNPNTDEISYNDSVEEEDMLFGVGRDIAQVELELYILCQIILGIGWDANKMGKWFWQSNKDRDLVILKNWVTVEK